MTKQEPLHHADIHDKGYVKLWTVMGNDLTVVNSARVSYNKRSEEMTEGDESLTEFLGSAEPQHSEPFYHPQLTFEVYADLQTARQIWKYITGATHQDIHLAWSESSRRYVTEEPTFYVPHADEWRSAPDNKKQGSGEPLHEDVGAHVTKELMETIDKGILNYETAMQMGVAPEMARLFLPAYGMYVRWTWTSSLKGIANFIEQRDHPDAQLEIQRYAVEIKKMVEKEFPVSLGALLGDK